MSQSSAVSAAALLVAIVATLGIVLAAALFLSTNDAGTQRLAIVVGLASLVLPQLVGMLRGDQAANVLNGTLDRRMTEAALRANYARRASDITPESASPAGTAAIDNPVTLAPIEPPPAEGLG